MYVFVEKFSQNFPCYPFLSGSLPSLDEAIVIRDHNIVLLRLKNFSMNYCQYPTYLEL